MKHIRTRTNPIRRFGAWLWQACDDHQWLPLAIVLVLLLIVNSVDTPT
jgi:hypothetical protein